MKFALIIYVSGKPSLNGFRIREFKWSEKHRKHIYLGSELPPERFNAYFEKAWRNNADLTPRVMVVPDESEATKPAPAETPAPSKEEPEEESAPPGKPAPLFGRGRRGKSPIVDVS